MSPETVVGLLTMMIELNPTKREAARMLALKAQRKSPAEIIRIIRSERAAK